jgi:hypothetical protein
MNKLEWEILNELTDDYEALKQISFSLQMKRNDESIDSLKNTLIDLFRNEYIFSFNNEGDSISKDIEKFLWDDMWFGLTEKGAGWWEENSEKFCGEKVDWDDIWYQNLDYKNFRGFVCARTKNKCLEIFEDLKCKNENITIVTDSIIHEKVDSFKYKYYKKFNDGYRISFSFVSDRR